MNRPVSAARAQWLEAGVVVLAEEGEAGLRIDRLAARVGLSKGSFHHHFAGAEGFTEALLAYVRELFIAPLRDTVAQSGRGTSPREVLAQFTALIGQDPDLRGLEVAVRAWATWDSAAARTVAEIDETRLSMLREVWRPTSATEEDARISALLPYLLGVGATVVHPPVTSDDLRRLFERLLDLVPETGVVGESSAPRDRP